MAKTVLEIPSPAMLLSTADLLRKSQDLRIESMERRVKLQFCAAYLRDGDSEIANADSKDAASVPLS